MKKRRKISTLLRKFKPLMRPRRPQMVSKEAKSLPKKLPRRYLKKVESKEVKMEVAAKRAKKCHAVMIRKRLKTKRA